MNFFILITIEKNKESGVEKITIHKDLFISYSDAVHEAPSKGPNTYILQLESIQCGLPGELKGFTPYPGG